MRRGRFGVPRPLGIGPLAPGGVLYNQPRESDEINEAVAEIVQENDNITGEVQPGTEAYQELLDGIASRAFPDSELKQERLKNCIDSDWGDGWATGLLESTGSEDEVSPTVIEEVAKATSGCIGMVDSNTIEL